jgi:DNA-binding SARP family transcriptional activator
MLSLLSNSPRSPSSEFRHNLSLSSLVLCEGGPLCSAKETHVTHVLASRFKPVLQKRQGLALATWGEAGIGKSYQVTQLLQALPCQSASFHATTPLTSLATLPKPKKLAIWAEHILERLNRGEAVETSNLIDALGATLASLAPFVLHLEDIHEADDERFSFIQELGKIASRSKGVGLVVTSRKEPLDPFTTFKLEPLSHQETDALLETELKATLPKEAKEFIYHKAAGNPLYTLEYLRFLTRQGLLWNDGKSWHWRKPEGSVMPTTVEALIEQLVTRAKTESLQQYVLESRTLLPLETNDDLWAKVARVSGQELQKAKTELSQQGIFREGDFAHPLFREVSLKTLNPERKKNLARRAVNVLESEPTQAALFVEDAKLGPEKTLAILKGAAESARENNEVEAARFLAKAVQYATGEEKSNLALEAAEGLRSHDMATAVRLAEGTLADEPDNLAAKVLLAKLYALLMRKEEAKAMFQRLPSNYKNSKEGFETLIEVYNRCEDNEVVVKAFNEQAPQFPPLSAPAISLVMGSLSGLSRFEEVEELATRTLATLEPTSWAYVLILHALAFMHNASNQYDKSEPEFRQAIDLIERHHAGRRLHIPLYNRALALMWLARVAEAKVEAERARTLALAVGDVVQYAKATNLLGQIEHELGQYEHAEELLLESADIFARQTPSQASIDVYSNLTALYLEWQGAATNPMLALKYARTSLQQARDFVTHYLIDGLHNVALAESYHGNPHYALGLAQEAQDAAREARTPLAAYYAATAKATALQALKRLDEARLEFMKVESLARETGLHLFAQKIGLELDRLNNDVESARTRMQWFQERGLLNGINIAKRYFPELAEAKESVTPAKSDVRLEVLGTLQVTREKLTPIRGRKRQELLALLLEARISGRSEVSRLTLLDSLYPDDDELKASASLKNLVHSLRETIGDNAIATTNNGYALGSCTSDAEVFLQTLDTALWRGPYLEGLDFAEESTLRESLYMALHDKAKTLLEFDSTEAARVGSILVETEPYNTECLKTYLTALRLSDNHTKLKRHYQEAQERLLEVGETLPETWQVFLESISSK